MVQRDDRRGLGEAVSLDDGKTETPPEFLDVRRQRGRAHDKRPELQAKRRMHAAVLPPPSWNRYALRRRLRRFWKRMDDVLAKDVENLRHADEHGHTTRLDQMKNVV